MYGKMSEGFYRRSRLNSFFPQSRTYPILQDNSSLNTLYEYTDRYISLGMFFIEGINNPAFSNTYKKYSKEELRIFCNLMTSIGELLEVSASIYKELYSYSAIRNNSPVTAKRMHHLLYIFNLYICNFCNAITNTTWRVLLLHRSNQKLFTSESNIQKFPYFRNSDSKKNKWLGSNEINKIVLCVKDKYLTRARYLALINEKFYNLSCIQTAHNIRDSYYHRTPLSTIYDNQNFTSYINIDTTNSGKIINELSNFLPNYLDAVYNAFPKIKSKSGEVLSILPKKVL